MYVCMYVYMYVCMSVCMYWAFKFPISLLQLSIIHCLFHDQLCSSKYSTFKFTQCNIQVLRNSTFNYRRCMFSISDRKPVNDSQCGLSETIKSHFLYSLRTLERGKIACGRPGRQTSARTTTFARLKISFVDMTYPGQRPKSPYRSPHFLLM